MTGEECRKSRIDCDMTQQEFAEALGYGGGDHAHNQISRLETGKVRITGPIAVSIRRLADSLRISREISQ